MDRNHQGCIQCHRTSDPAVIAGDMAAGALDMSLICMDCHDYGANHHPVNFTPRDSFNPSFPLFDGQVKCLTCHEAHGRDNRTQTGLLRGAPYKDRREICFRCHSIDAYANLNPHIMFDQTGRIRQVQNSPVCLMCHERVPGQKLIGEEITFKADVGFLCWRCHPPMPDSFMGGHFLVKPSRATLRRMRKFTSEKKIKLPLLNRDRITCSTCHNPHQDGIIRDPAAAAGADAPARLRIAKETICGGCHPY